MNHCANNISGTRYERMDESVLFLRSQPTHQPTMTTYKIVRSFHPSLDKSGRIIARGLTLEEAQSHCKNPKTRKDGEWFDGYESEN